MNRVFLINKTRCPSRDELVTEERKVGEVLFSAFPNLRFAGYMIAHGKLVANWIIDPKDAQAFQAFARSFDCEDYAVEVFAPGLTHHGGQCEVRVV